MHATTRSRERPPGGARGQQAMALTITGTEITSDEAGETSHQEEFPS
jgi:hypothetical protein